MSNLSILVVSKSAPLLSELLRTIPGSLEGFGGDVEVLCSWNGSPEDEKKVEVPGGIELYFSQREPYHFAKNCNQLARQACGDLLLFINDDVSLNIGAIQAAIHTLETRDQCGIVGAKLINKNGHVGHAGILFDQTHKPFHRYLNCPADHPLTERTERVPATTGAFLVTRAQDYARCPMNETYINNGEDVELCLCFSMRLGLHTYICHAAKGFHPERSTRSNDNVDAGFGNDNSQDLLRTRKIRQQYLETLNREELAHELNLASRESSWCHQQISSLETYQQEILIEAERIKSQALKQEAQKEEKISASNLQLLAELALEEARQSANKEISQGFLHSERARQRTQTWKETFRSSRGT